MFVWLGSFAVLPFLMFFPAWSLLLWTLGFPQGSLRSVFVIFGLLFLHVGFFDLGHLLGVSQVCLHLSFELVVREGKRRALEGAVVDGNITGVLHFEKSRRQHHVKFNVVLVHVCNVKFVKFFFCNNNLTRQVDNFFFQNAIQPQF